MVRFGLVCPDSGSLKVQNLSELWHGLGNLKVAPDSLIAFFDGLQKKKMRLVFARAQGEKTLIH